MRKRALLPAVNAPAQPRAVPSTLCSPAPQQSPRERLCPRSGRGTGPGRSRGRGEAAASRARTGRGLLQVLLQQRLLQHELEPRRLRRRAWPAGGGGLPVRRLGAHAGSSAGSGSRPSRPRPPRAAQDGGGPRPLGGGPSGAPPGAARGAWGPWAEGAPGAAAGSRLGLVPAPGAGLSAQQPGCLMESLFFFPKSLVRCVSPATPCSRPSAFAPAAVLPLQGVRCEQSDP